MNEDMKLVLEELRKVNNRIDNLESNFNARMDSMETRLNNLNEDMNLRFENINSRITKLSAEVKETRTFAEKAALYSGELFDRLASDTDARLRKLEAK